MRRKTQVPARIIKACKTQEQKDQVEQLFIHAYASYLDERIAWKQVELKLFGYSLS